MVLRWLTISLMIALLGGTAPALPVASVSTHPFGRYEILLQEGMPVAMGEFLGLVRRQTGLPEYPLMIGARQRLLELHLLGPGNRPYRLTSVEFVWAAVSRAGLARFVVERSVREGESLAMQLRHASLPVHVRLAVDLRGLERLLEGEL
jgi:hypothetical protein